MRILFTNTSLLRPGGTELGVRDMAIAMKNRGHHSMVYSSDLGLVSEDIARNGIEVVNDLTKLSSTPELIHGNHHMETMISLLFFPGVPAIYHCHGYVPWQEAPPVHPRIHLYLAIGDKTKAFVKEQTGANDDDILIVHNYADTDRFKPAREHVPATLKRALIFDRYMLPAESQIIVEACRNEGILCDTFQSLNPPLAHPEQILNRYDLVFAVGKSAIEALATGAAVITCTAGALGEMILDENVQVWQRRNFTGFSDHIPIKLESVRKQIQRYHAPSIDQARDHVRTTASLSRYTDKIAEAHARVIRCASSQSPADEAQERIAMTRYWRLVKSQMVDLDVNRRQGWREIERLTAEHDAARTKLAIMEHTLAWRLRHVLLKMPIVGRILDRAGKVAQPTTINP